MANSANYLLSKMLINMTILENSVRDLQESIRLQIELVKKVAVSPELQDEIGPMKECLIADTQLEREFRLLDTLPTPEEYAKVSGEHLDLFFNCYLECWVPTWEP
jgi:hypothetical protein